MFVLVKVYKRREMHKMFDGQEQGGISTPLDRNFIMLFTGKQGAQYGYHDEWTDDGLFLLTGEGQRGNMEFVRSNLAIRDHETNGKDLILFEYVASGLVCHVGQMVCAGYHRRRSKDSDGNYRQTIVFELTPINVFDTAIATISGEESKELWEESLTASYIPFDQARFELRPASWIPAL